jgi:hypothetical protein
MFQKSAKNCNIPAPAVVCLAGNPLNLRCMKHILPFIVMIVILLIISNIISNLMDFSLKKRVLDAGAPDGHTAKIIESLSDFRSSALKWGILLFSGGLGLIVLEFLPCKAEDSLLPYGVEALFLSGGFLTFYFVSKKAAA